MGKLLAPAAPKVSKETLAPTPMPTVDDDAVAAARRRQIAASQQRSGRASTMLSQAGQTIAGGGAVQRGTLGG